VGKAVTLEKNANMLCNFIPYVYFEGPGYSCKEGIKGEVYIVDAEVMKDLDILESGYTKLKIPV
jgi:gamma-glutamylcyclotransferase (GGCT)/AIG2-like uncharacterized protein YtfP